MTALFILLLLLGTIVAAAYLFDVGDRTEQLREQERRAARAIDEEARRARRAMNDAADQSWRNLVE